MISYNEIYSVVMRNVSAASFTVDHFVISFKKRQLKLDEIMLPWMDMSSCAGQLGHD